MGGGLMQLVAYGAQDIYLTGNPQITFFKVVYRRHTNFAIEAIEQTFTGSVDFGRKISCTVDRNGDLVHKMYLEVDMSVGQVAQNAAVQGATFCNRLGHALIREVSVEIGGQCMDTHYGEWLELWSQLTMTDEELSKLRRLIDGNIRDTAHVGSVGGATVADTDRRKLYIPLQFWFNRNPGLALPLIALQYHEVKINVFLEDLSGVGISSGTNAQIHQVCLFCDYIFLDTDERRRFAQVSHEYLIEQVQFNNITSVPAKEACANVELRFNHPCKELVWTAQPQINGKTSGTRINPFDFSRQDVATPTRSSCQAGVAQGLDSVLKTKLQLNGHDRFREREGTYFRCVQPFQHHVGAHLQGGSYTDGSDSEDNGFFYNYSFALKPEEHQPSGTCNFSRIDNATLQLNLAVVDHANAVDRFVKVWATNYNVLRIMSGMGGLAYSN
jgi:hypothetical protein